MAEDQSQRKFLLKKDPPDPKDYPFKALVSVSVDALPDAVDMRSTHSAIRDQSNLGACSGFAFAGFREHDAIAKGVFKGQLSPMYLYWHEREIMGTINEDSGAYLRDGMKVLQTNGIPLEKSWPYNIAKFMDKPSDQAETDAAAYKISAYHRVWTFDELLQALATGYPVVCGIEVFESFVSAQTTGSGMVPVPNRDTERFHGGHAIDLCGYRTRADGRKEILFRNSWGVGWGIQGYGWIHEDFWAQGFVMDMWTGTSIVTPESLTFKDAIDVFVKDGIFDGPEFWANFEAKYKAGTLTNADFEFAFLGYRKLAARLLNGN